MGSMELNPEILKTSATIDCMEQNASVAAAALLALTIVKMTRNPAELMYSTPPRSTTTFLAPESRSSRQEVSKLLAVGCVDPSGKRNDTDATLFRCDNLHTRSS